MSVLTKSTLTVDWSTGSVGPQVSGVRMSVVPQVSLTLETYRWDPHLRVKNRKRKKGKGLRTIGPNVDMRPNNGRLGFDGLAQEAARSPARAAAPVTGRLVLAA